MKSCIYNLDIPTITTMYFFVNEGKHLNLLNNEKISFGCTGGRQVPVRRVLSVCLCAM